MGSGDKGGGGGGAHDYYGTIAGIICAGPVASLVAIIQDKKVIWPEAPEWIYSYGESYTVGDLVNWEGRVWRCITNHTSHPDFPPGVAPEWVQYSLKRTDPGVTNPIQITVTGYGIAALYWGTDDQTLDAVNTPVFASTHPPYRRQCFVILRQWLFGRERVSAPNVEFIVTREPIQSVVTGTAAALDADSQANPLALAAEVLTDPVFGIGSDPSTLDAASWQATADALTADAGNTHLSPVLAQGKTVRSFISELLGYFDGWNRFDPQGRIVAGRWNRHVAAPIFTDATTITVHDLIDEAEIESDGWSSTTSAAVVRYTDRLRAFKTNASSAVSSFNRSITGESREVSVDRPWITRSAQALAYALELAQVSAEPGMDGTLVVRREKCTEIEPGTRFRLVNDALGLTLVCRCTGKTLDAPPAMRATLRYTLEKSLTPPPAVPAPPGAPVYSLPAPEVVSLFEITQPPPLLAGESYTLLVLAARTALETVSMRVHLREADGTLFQELGRQSNWAVKSTLQANYSSTEAIDDDTENLRLTLDPLTIAPDLLSIQETQSADMVNDDTMLLVVIRAAAPAESEVMTLKAIRIVGSDTFYRLKVRRARFGSSRLSFVTGDRAWIIRRASLVVYRHTAFPGYAEDETTITLRLQPRNLYGREADLADTAACPNRSFAFGTGGIWVPAAPSALAVSTTLSDFILTWTDNSDTETGFRVEYSTDGTTWTSAGTVSPGVTTKTVTGGPYDVTVFFRVFAYNAAGDSAASGLVSAYIVDPSP